MVQRLLDSAPLRRLLNDGRDRDLAYVVSDSLYEDVVQTGFCSLPPTEFEPIRVKAKGTTFRGHIFTGRARDGGVDGWGSATGRTTAPPGPGPCSPSPGWSGRRPSRRPH